MSARPVDTETERYKLHRQELLAAAEAADSFVGWVESAMSIEDQRPILTNDPVLDTAAEALRALRAFCGDDPSEQP